MRRHREVADGTLEPLKFFLSERLSSIIYSDGSTPTHSLICDQFRATSDQKALMISVKTVLFKKLTVSLNYFYVVLRLYRALILKFI